MPINISVRACACVCVHLFVHVCIAVMCYATFADFLYIPYRWRTVRTPSIHLFRRIYITYAVHSRPCLNFRRFVVQLYAGQTLSLQSTQRQGNKHYWRGGGVFQISKADLITTHLTNLITNIESIWTETEIKGMKPIVICTFYHDSQGTQIEELDLSLSIYRN